MIAMLDTSNLANHAIHDYIHSVERNKITMEKNIRDVEVVEKLMSLSQVYIFFEDLYKYHSKMNLSDHTLEKFVLDIDDLIDSFEEYTILKKTSNKLLNDYYAKATAFYKLLVKLQFELGFALSDRKYKVWKIIFKTTKQTHIGHHDKYDIVNKDC